MIHQRDLASPSGWDRTSTPDDSRGFGLRSRVYRVIRDGRDLRDVAEAAGVSSYALTAWLRGDEELDGEAVGCLYAISRGAM